MRHLKGAPRLSMGDILDKMTILTRKVFFGEEEAIEELTYLQSSLTKMGFNGKMIASIIRLAQMNFEIWNRENELRKGGEKNLPSEEIAKRALEIRDFNRKRVRYKNDINKLTGLGFTEFKIKHRSQ